MRLRCSEKFPPAQRDTRVSCLRKGVGIGKRIASTKKLSMALSKDIIRDIARTSGISGYSNMTKVQLYEALIARGITTYTAR